MTRKHFKAIAAILAMHTEVDDREEMRWILARHLADYFAQENPSFNRDVFLKAANV